MKIDVSDTDKIKKFEPRVTFPEVEVARIKAYQESMGIGPMTQLIPLIRGTLTPGTPNPASGASADSPSRSQAYSPSLSQAHSQLLSQVQFPSLSQAALAGGKPARPWNQLAREWADADKSAAAMVGERTAQGSTAEESAGEVAYPRYVGPDFKSADPLPLTHDTSGVLVIYYPEEMGDESWNEEDDDWYNSPPPPIPFLVEIETKAKLAQSNEAVELWLEKV